MKKIYKTLSLSSLAAITLAAPVALAVSCGGEEGTQNDPLAPTELELDGAFTLSPVVIREAKEFLASNADKYPILSSADAVSKIRSVSPEELQEFSTTGKIDGKDEEVQVLSEVQAFLLKLFYAKNEDREFNEGVAAYLNNQSNTIQGIDGKRGPWVVDRAKGGAPDYVNPSFHRILNDDGVTSLQDSWTTGTSTKDKTYNVWNTYSGSALQNKPGEPSFTNGSTTSTLEGQATVLPLIRTQTVGEDVYKNGSWQSTRSFVKKFEGAESITVGGQQYSDPSSGDLETALNNPANDTITFNIKQGVKYVNGRGEQTNYNLRGRDFFLGFVHQIYTDLETRETGAYGLAKLSDSEIAQLKSELTEAGYDEYVNYNMYLFDLYNVDIEQTILANERLSEEDRDTKFVVKFNVSPSSPISTTALQFFCDTNIASPVSSEKIEADWGGVTPSKENEPGKYYGITSYMPINHDGTKFTDVQDWITVAPYYFTSYDITPTTGKIEIKKNPYYIDQTFATRTNTIDTFATNISDPSADQSAWAQQRKNAFLNGDELVLDSTAKTVKTVTDSIVESNPSFKTIVKPFTQGYVGNITWNPFGYDAAGFNDLGRKLMFGGAGDGVGAGTVDAVKNDFDALEGFFSGNGARVKAIIASSINWYTVAQMYAPGQNQSYWQSILGPELVVYDGKTANQAGGAFAKSSYTEDTASLQKIYESNLADVNVALTTSKTESAGRALDELAASVGATEQNKAIIPFQFYEFTDSPTAESVQQANIKVLNQLNKLSPKVTFVRATSQTWTEFGVTSNRQKNGVSLMHSFGKDYDGFGSMAQQYMTSYATNSELEFVYEILKA